MSHMTSQRHKELYETYMFVFDSFATTRSEVADQFLIGKVPAINRLKALEGVGLITRVDVNEEAQGAWRSGKYKELTWQAWQTYDDYSREEAALHFLAALPYPPGIIAHLFYSL